MSVTYSETGSNYTYLDANILPADYNASQPHIRHLAYYISQKTPSKKTRIVDVRVALSSYLDWTEQIKMGFIVGKTTASNFTSADFVHTKYGTTIKNFTPFASSKNLAPFITPSVTAAPVSAEYYSWALSDNIYLPKIILKEGESLAIIEVQNEFKNVLIDSVNKYDIPHPNNVSTISIMGFEEDTTIDLVSGEEITGDNIGEGLDYMIDNNHPWGIGEFWPAQGGYYGGKYVVGNDIRAIIVSPKEEGELTISTQFTHDTTGNSGYGLVSSQTGSFNSLSPNGDMLDSNTSKGDNQSLSTGALNVLLNKTINGKVDWRIGSYFELLTIFSNLNPGINLDRPDYVQAYLTKTDTVGSSVAVYNENTISGHSRYHSAYTRFRPMYKSNHGDPNSKYHKWDYLYIGINPYSIPPRLSPLRPPRYDFEKDNVYFYKRTLSKNFQITSSQTLYSPDSLYLTSSMLKINPITAWQRKNGQMCISPCFSDYQTIESYNMTGSPKYEVNLISGDNSNFEVDANSPGPNIIIRLIRTVTIGQITP